MKAIIYYNDGSEVLIGGEDDELVPIYFSKKWLEAPADGVAQIDVEKPEGTSSLNEYEFYYQMPFHFHGEGTIGASNKIGPFLRQSCMPYSLVKFGGWTNNANYQAIKKRARDVSRKRLIPVVVKQREQEEASD